MLIIADRILTDTGTYLEGGAVLVEGDAIAAVGPRADVVRQAGPGVRQLVHSGTVLPGLIDSHVHLIFDGGTDPVAGLGESDEVLHERMCRRAERLLRAGVTTARDLGDRGGLAFRVAGPDRPRTAGRSPPRGR
ncbi:amidohydrolase family protein [Streptomyces formicae]|uniref:Xaa-Pro dipeptidase n=1 Tax=Streptomyces formicae TaxID=1616117 RepID=A0A291Q0H7_9ACTN|nr:amidohydrolase family protein [Streptomyces formicae]ATL25211.1 Xaa-Pro dipeptidase [Streptomyces formicae]